MEIKKKLKTKHKHKYNNVLLLMLKYFLCFLTHVNNKYI